MIILGKPEDCLHLAELLSLSLKKPNLSFRAEKCRMLVPAHYQVDPQWRFTLNGQGLECTNKAMILGLPHGPGGGAQGEVA